MESQAPQAARPEKKNPVTKPAPANEVLGKPVVYSGFFTDYLRAQNKRALFSLKTPIDPQKDLENISFYPGTDKIQGVVLFSIKF